MAGWNHANAKWAEKQCAVCGTGFTPKSGAHKFCSEQCKGKWPYITGVLTTESQYERISGNWHRYYLRLLQGSGRKQDGLTTQVLLALHERQGGMCALSGAPLTCELVKGAVCFTNASIDRIIPGGAYSPDNIQLVCRHVNSWRSTMPVEDFVQVCRAVVAKFDGGKNG
jgi:hypothetical protein